MTKVAILADIHGNLPALERVLADLAQFPVDQVIVAGDVINWGPFSAAVTERALAEGWAIIRGNNEYYLLDYETPRAPALWRDPVAFPMLPWLKRQLAGHLHRQIAAWPDTISFRPPDAPPLRIVHGSPRSPWEPIYPDASESDIAAMLDGVAEGTIVAAHTHIPMNRRIGRWHLLNPGSVGVPILGEQIASYLLLEGDESGWHPTFRSLPLGAEVNEAVLREFARQGFAAECGIVGELVLEEFRTARIHLSRFLAWRAATCPEAPYTAATLARYRASDTGDYLPPAYRAPLAGDTGMTRVAVLADIHGNLPALDAVRADLARCAVDQVVVAGDVVNWGPFSAQVVERILAEGWAVIRGNHEYYLLDYGTPRAPALWHDPDHFSTLPWLRRQLPERLRARIAAWPDTICLRPPDAPPLRIVHGTPRSPWEPIFPWATPEELASLLAGIEEETIVTAHVHMPIDMRRGRWHIVNPSSVGLPLDGTWDAIYLILDGDANGWHATFRRVPYDIAPIYAEFARQGFVEECGVIGELILEEFRTSDLQIVPFHHWRTATCPHAPFTPATLAAYRALPDRKAHLPSRHREDYLLQWHESQGKGTDASRCSE